MTVFFLFIWIISPIRSAVVVGWIGGIALAGLRVWWSRRAAADYRIELHRMLNSPDWVELDRKEYRINRPPHLWSKTLSDPEQFSRLEYYRVTKHAGEYILLAYLEQLELQQTRVRGFPFTILSVRLSRTLPGWVRLWPVNRLFQSFKQVDLESIQFNKLTYLVAEPKDIAVKVFAPDFMAWYLDLPDRPLVHVEGDTCCVMIEGRISRERLTELTNTLLAVKRFVERSGALA